MDPDWHVLTPHRPLDLGDPAYIERPTDSGQAIADLVLAGKNTVLVAGPVGVGKSTELAAAALKLQPNRVVCLVPLDRFENMRRITAEQALLRIAGQLAYVAFANLHLGLSPELRSALYHQGVLAHDLAPPQGSGVFRQTPANLARNTIREVTRLSPSGRVAIFIDGTEKVGGETAVELFDALGSLPDELDLVIVVPWHAAYGPRAGDVVRPGERLVSIRALPVEGPSGDDGRLFLRRILERRLGPASLPAEVLVFSDRAAEWSGGIPRMFLQLTADAATNARLRGHGPWPTLDDLTDAAADLQDSFRRILLPGDTEALRAVDGTDGREMPLDRKVRLLAHAALLERAGERGPVMMPHPLVRALLGGGSADA